MEDDLAFKFGRFLGKVYDSVQKDLGLPHRSEWANREIESSGKEPEASATDQAISLLNVDDLIRCLDDKIPEYASAVESHVANAIRQSETSDLLEIRLYGILFANDPKWAMLRPGRRPNWLLSKERPPKPQWAHDLVKYMKNDQDCKFRYEAGVEEIVSKACDEASKEYFTSPEVREIVNSELVKSVDSNDTLQKVLFKEFQSTGKLIKQEFKDATKAHGHAVAADRVHDVLAHAVGTASATSAGVVVTKMVASSLAMPVVKMAIVKAVTVGLANSAIQSAIHAAAKHCGLTTIAVVFLGHTAGSAIMGVVAVPLILAVIAHQWITLPSTLAKKMAPSIAQEIRKKAPDINRSIAENIKEAVVKEIIDLPKEAMKRIHKTAMKKIRDPDASSDDDDGDDDD